MTIRWDALLVRELARELDARLSGMRLRALRLDGESRDAVLHFHEATLVWRLHPRRGTLALTEAVDPAPDALRLPSRVRRVHAPPDERLITFELLPTRSGRRAHDLIVELLGNQWNLLVTEGEERVLRHVLNTRVGARVLRVGRPYELPAPSAREGVDGALTLERWREIVLGAPQGERRRALVNAVAWTSPVIAGALLPPPGDPEATRSGHDLWRSLATREREATPVVLDFERGPQPYPYAVPDAGSKPTGSLLDAFARLAEREDAPDLAADPGLMRRLDRELETAQRRHTSLVAELDGLPDPEALRARGDLILARFRDIPAGAAAATLEDFEGRPITVELEVGAPPQQSAGAYYDRAARAERAAARLPDLIEDASERVSRLSGLVELAREGAATDEEVEALLPSARAEKRRAETEESLPYRRYRSSGGLEIRVGRGARHNDDLTFHHAAPNDVWLHARHSAGAHVVLRWAGPGNPPARDLAEAAVLAALHSKARTSGSAPVDWTLRKYVRKPRKAPPGAVTVERVKTLFVTPDPGVVERLSWD